LSGAGEITGAIGGCTLASAPYKSRKAVNSAGIVPINRGDDQKSWPHNDDAERNILGAILLHDRAFEIAIANIRQEEFFLSEHRMIFWAMTELERRGDPIEPMSIIDFLQAKGKLDADMPAYISSLPNGLPRLTSVGFYCRAVRLAWIQRQVAHLAIALHDAALEPASVETGVPPALSHYIQELNETLETDTPQTTEELRIPDMPEEVLDGRLGEICKRRLSDFPISYAWTALVTAAGTLVPPTQQVRTNLYGVLVGPPQSAKSTTTESAIKTLGVAKPVLEETLSGSFEGLAEKLDVNGDARLLNPDELGHLLTKASIDGASFPFALNSLYYKDQFDLTVARGKKIHVNCRLSFIGGVVETHFPTLFGPATTAGLDDRCIFGRCPSPYQYAYRPFEGGAENVEPCAVTVASDVYDLRDEWLKTIPGISARWTEHAIRIGVIAASFSGRSILYAKHIEKSARAFVEYQVRVRAVLKPNPGENVDARCAFAIKAVLAQKPGWNLKRDIAKAIHSERYGPSVLERAINSLEAAGDIDVDRKRPAKLRLVGL
jgi:hypothetical protein